MPNPIFNPKPNYSGVTIQIMNPAMNVGPYGVNGAIPTNYATYPQQAYYYDSEKYAVDSNDNKLVDTQQLNQSSTNPINNPTENNDNKNLYTNGFVPAYPAGYYLNDYSKANNNFNLYNNYPNDLNKNAVQPEENSVENPHINTNGVQKPSAITSNEQEEQAKPIIAEPYDGTSKYKDFAKTYESKQPESLDTSKNIINSLDERNIEIKEAKKNTKEKKIVALTDEYIMSLENYLNNENDEIRLMASKEILTRLDEDRSRYDDKALNALLNKMLQDPSKLIRLAALSAFASGLACGNEYTIALLQNIQANPDADKEDVLQAADILLKMSSGVEVKNVPVETEDKREKFVMKQ